MTTTQPMAFYTKLGFEEIGVYEIRKEGEDVCVKLKVMFCQVQEMEEDNAS